MIFTVAALASLLLVVAIMQLLNRSGGAGGEGASSDKVASNDVKKKDYDATPEVIMQAPELVNQEPYGGGWIMRLKPSASLASADLLNADAYAAFAEAG